MNQPSGHDSGPWDSEVLANLVAGSGRSAVDTVAVSRDCKVALANWGVELGSSAEASGYVEASEN